jgi:hypothetical protein
MQLPDAATSSATTVDSIRPAPSMTGVFSSRGSLLFGSVHRQWSHSGIYSSNQLRLPAFVSLDGPGVCWMTEICDTSTIYSLLFLRNVTLRMLLSFCNAEIACPLELDGRVIGYIDVDQGRCLSTTVTRAEIERRDGSNRDMIRTGVSAMESDPKTLPLSCDPGSRSQSNSERKIGSNGEGKANPSRELKNHGSTQFCICSWDV